MVTPLRPQRGRSGRTAVLALVAATALPLAACGSGESTTDSPEQNQAQAQEATVADPIAVTYEGGIYVLDGNTLEVAKDIPLDGFNRLNAAGDDRHLLVSTSTGFRVLDARTPALTDLQFTGTKPGHVVRHAGRTVLFDDGTGEITVFDPTALGAELPPTHTHRTPQAHHGVAVQLANGELVTSLGNEDERPGIVVLDKDGAEVARNEDCPGVHGEATAEGEAVVIGCETGVLIYRDGTITKVSSPDPYGRIGNQAGSETSPITLGDYKRDKDAELERPTRISLIDTASATLELVDIGTSYTFRSLGRGPEGEALVLGTDGQIHVIDEVAGTVTRTIPVLDEWREPLEWQEPRPALFVRGATAYVTDPARKEISAVDLTSGQTVMTGKLPAAPNEISGTVT